MVVQAAAERRKIQKSVKEGKTGPVALMSWRVARCLLPLSEEAWKIIEEKGQEIGFRSLYPLVEVTLEVSADKRKEAYNYLYGLPQAVDSGFGPLEAEKIPPFLLEEIPWFQETMNQVAQGKLLDEEDQTVLHYLVRARYVSMGTLAHDLKHPDNMFAYKG